MPILISIVQVAVALTLLNVWLLRFNKRTPYRGGNASSMIEEFAAYGLPPQVAYTVGFLKVTAALCLIAGVWISYLVFPSGILIGILMLGAIAMHIKIKDPAKKSMPAFSILVLCICICAYSIRQVPYSFPLKSLDLSGSKLFKARAD